MRVTLLALLVASLMIPFSGFAETATPAVPTPVARQVAEGDRAAIEDIIHDYLVNRHPEVLKEAFEELQHREQAKADAKSKEAVTQENDRIYNDPRTPVGGNPKGDVTIVEFFDFQCGYCKMAEEAVEKILKEDKGIRFVYKDFPILGPVSVTASKAALASINQNKYVAFHDAMMTQKEHLTDDMIYDIAKKVGLNVDRLKKDMADDAIAKQIDENVKLGTSIGVRGTPMFIIGKHVFPGAIQYDAMQKAVADERAAPDKK